MTDQPVHGCTGKMAFNTQKRAARHAKWMRRKYHNCLTEYHCTHCHMWHIGEFDDARIRR